MQKAIVIGASSGIGLELSKILAKSNHLVGITGRRKTLLKNLQAESPTYFIVESFDCTKENAIEHLEKLVNKLNGLDVLIFNSGMGEINKNLNYTIEEETNKLNVVAFTKIVGWGFNYFKNQGQGQLVAISSIAGLRGGRHAPAYNASKAYQISYLEGLRQKTKKLNLNITITDIRPGFVDTDMAKGDGKFWVAPKEKAAKQIYNHIVRKNDVAYVTKRWYFVAIFVKILPNWLYNRL